MKSDVGVGYGNYRMMGKAGYRDLKIIHRYIEYDIVVIRFGWTGS